MTYVTDPIGDMLTRIRNAQKSGRTSCVVPMSKLRFGVLQVFKREGWIADVAVTGEAPKQQLEIVFAPEKGALTLKRISKPGRRTYASVQELTHPVLHGFGMAILTTSKGILTDKEAREQKVGGEVLCTIA